MALQLAAEAGATTILNPAPALGLDRDLRRGDAHHRTDRARDLAGGDGDEIPTAAARRLFDTLSRRSARPRRDRHLGSEGAIIVGRRGLGWRSGASSAIGQAIDDGRRRCLAGALAVAIAEAATSTRRSGGPSPPGWPRPRSAPVRACRTWRSSLVPRAPGT
jgi:hypothetical protein